MRNLRYMAAAIAVIVIVVRACDRQEPKESAGTASDSAAVVDTTGAAATPADVQTQIDAHADLVRLEKPAPNAFVESPLEVTGEARGGWYFEASFPVVLTDWDGLIIAEGSATAEGEWTTEDFVPFHATLHFQAPAQGDRGTLVLRKANPSGRPENGDALEIPIRFAGD